MPAAALMLAVLVPMLEPVGFPSPANSNQWAGVGTLLGYHLTPPAAAAILGSAVLG